MPSVTPLRRLILPIAAALLAAAPARAQSAETAAATPSAGDTVRGTAAGNALRQRWASPFAVEGSGHTEERPVRAHVTWLKPDTTRPR
ncbi:MAG: hypothetical protein JWM27_1298, partial [Gemmatimonadetes bacterium]|nr:hypothetical protein [Gemmatimonadota bacterium]